MIRRQLSLFVADSDAARIEALRRLLDPVQQALIAAHATLAREDELAGLGEDAVQAFLDELDEPALRLEFGEAEGFYSHGILIRCVDGAKRYHALRARLLGANARSLVPHLTLAHPRNARAAGNSLEAARAALPAQLALRFDSLNLIEQREGARWRVLVRVSLA